MSTLSVPSLFIEAFCNEQGIGSKDYNRIFILYKDVIVKLWNKYLSLYEYQENAKAVKRYSNFISVNMIAEND